MPDMAADGKAFYIARKLITTSNPVAKDWRSRWEKSTAFTRDEGGQNIKRNGNGQGYNTNEIS